MFIHFTRSSEFENGIPRKTSEPKRPEELGGSKKLQIENLVIINPRKILVGVHIYEDKTGW